jgi:hypothetical protein
VQIATVLVSMRGAGIHPAHRLFAVVCALWYHGRRHPHGSISDWMSAQCEKMLIELIGGGGEIDQHARLIARVYHLKME